MTQLLQPKVKKNDAELAKGKADLNAHASVLVSSLAVVVLLKKYNFGIETAIERLLLKCLALEMDPTSKKCTAYEVVLEEFSEELRL